MRKKLIFIDIDGTLVSREEKILPSTRKAIAMAKANGHQLFLCTGRNKPEIFPYISNLSFAGCICAGGSYVEVADQLIYHKTIPDELFKKTINYLLKQEVDFYIESKDGLYTNKRSMEHLRSLTKLAADEKHPFFDLFQIIAEYEIAEVSNICFIGDDAPLVEIISLFKDDYEIIAETVPLFGKNSGELIVKGCSKKSAIETVIEHLKWNPEDTLAIGDGRNDIEMFKACNIGIAMGNAHETLKEVADIITDHLEEDGFYKAFVSVGVV